MAHRGFQAFFRQAGKPQTNHDINTSAGLYRYTLNLNYQNYLKNLICLKKIKLGLSWHFLCYVTTELQDLAYVLDADQIDS